MSRDNAAVICTGQSASWCPRCGDCVCERTHDGDCCFNNEDCPLHGPQSQHAETISLDEIESRIDALADDCGVELTANDRDIVTRFAQLLLEKSRKQKESS